MSDESEDDTAWRPPTSLSPEQLVDWEQARQYAEVSRAVRQLGRRTEALEKLIEKVVRPVVEEAAAWMTAKRRITETLWDSGVGPIKTGPTIVALSLIVGLAIMAQQCGVNPIQLSNELRSWKNGECVSADS